MKNKIEGLKKEQLLIERAFINYCNNDKASNYTATSLSINQKFLKAAGKDGFIKPLLKIKELVKQEEGTEKLETVNYYSPFQIYLALELSKNIIDEKGYLRSPHSLEWQKEKNFRWVKWGWGGTSLTVTKRQWERNIKFSTDNLPLFCDYFHRFLVFLHTLELKPEHIRKIERERFFSNLPSLDYNFEPLQNKGLKLLKRHKLNIKILNLLRKEVAQLATMIDPLERWYYYIQRHTQFRKDLLKGDAALAQELYRIYDLLTTIIKTITGKKSKPLFEFLYQDFPYPFLMPKVEYQEGEDLKALQFAIRQFKEWKQKNNNKMFVNDEITNKIVTIEKELTDYEKRYGDRNYAGSVRTIETEKNIKLENLDEETKKYVENTIKQKGQQEIEVNIEQEIAHTIEHRLWELKRELQQIFWSISKQFSDKKSEWWQKYQNFSDYFWGANRKKLAKFSREQQRKLAKKELNKITKEAERWDTKSKEFFDFVSKYAALVFCKVCRKNPIQLHIENNNLNMWEVSRSIICDECMRTKKLEKIESGEWKCSCGKILYKFVHNNTIALQTLNKVDIKLKLKYGKSELEATCPECGRKTQRIIDWGWMP